MPIKQNLLLLLLFWMNLCFAQPGVDLNLGAMVQPVSEKHKFIDPDFNIWGASVVKGYDGKYHMFYSRWPRKLGHFAWVTHSEIAYAVADKAEGPYRPVNVALPARGRQFWDGTTTHNPTVFKKDGKYYLYYMGTTSPVDAQQPTSMKNKDWWMYRNNQRIGVAWAEKPEGPWHRLDYPVIDVSPDPKAPDALMVSNPAVNIAPDGSIFAVYKVVGKQEGWKPVDLNSADSWQVSKGSRVRYMAATADSPLGPFKKYKKTIFEMPGSEEEWMIAEDPYVWSQNNKYYAVCCDTKGWFTGDPGAFGLIESDNGVDWKVAKHPLVVPSRILKDDGTRTEYKLERPQLLVEDGVPTLLLGALGITVNGVHRGHACNLRVPLKKPDKEEFNFAALLPEKFDKANIIAEDDYNVWGTNILKGKDGKYHAIYSRWPKSRGHHGWVTHSEIAHAVSDNLIGPYTFKNVVLPARGNQYWDGDCTHNPHVVEYKGKYYLYLMGNHGSGYWNNTPPDRMPSMKDEEWWINRNNQRIGVAVTDDLNGEWQRFDKPLVDTVNGRWMTSTPTVSVRPDGKFLMVYKYVTSDPNFKYGKVIHVTALSDSPEGPFKDTGIPFITHPTASFALDDHVEWFGNEKYYCIIKDSRGVWSNYPDGSMLLFESDSEGLNWKPAENLLVLEAGQIHWTDGTTTLCERTADMPKLYMENGKPKALIIAVLPKDSEISFSLVIPLKSDNQY